MSEAATEAPKPKRGRPKGSKNKAKDPNAEPKKRGKAAKVTPFVDVDIAGTRIDTIRLAEIDLDDEVFKFRVNLRVSALAESIAQEGQQFPVVLRRKKDGKLQIISGFRRITAIRSLGWDTVKAVVRADLDDDGEACKVSILENEARQTYNDLDRAYAILAYRRLGKGNAEIEEIFKVGARQRQRLEELTSFPAELQKAVASEKVSSTNAVRLMQYARKHPGADLAHWIKWVGENNATYAQLNSALAQEAAGAKKGKSVELFITQKKGDKQSLRFRPVSLDENLNSRQKQKLIKDLQKAIEFVEGLGQ